ncbi:MAG: hypothetical protein K6A43_13015 [Treponema sp.]|nr:hypothetical protein [Treponema sp.]
MTAKILLLAASFIVAGISFLFVGIYFSSQSFLNKLNQASPQNDPAFIKRNTLRSKGCGYTSIGLGAFTIVWGILTFIIPQAAAIFGLVYMFILILSVTAIIIMFR